MPDTPLNFGELDKSSRELVIHFHVPIFHDYFCWLHLHKKLLNDVNIFCNHIILKVVSCTPI